MTDEAWRPIAVCAWRVLKSANSARKEKAESIRANRKLAARNPAAAFSEGGEEISARGPGVQIPARRG